MKFYERVFITFSFLGLALGFLFVVYLIYLTLYPFKIVELYEDPIKINKTELLPGEEITILMNFRKNYDFTPTVKYFIVDGFLLELPDGGINRKVGDNIVSRSFYVPGGISPGKYHIQVELSYPVTAWRNIHYSWKTETFTIINGN